jgi:hypothetical protein
VFLVPNIHLVVSSGTRLRTSGRLGVVSTKDTCSLLRAAAYRGDGLATIALLAETGISTDGLQLAGDGVLAALGQHVEGAPEFAERLVPALSERNWEGDEELADQLRAALGAAGVQSLSPLAVDLDQLAAVREGDPISDGGRLDLRTGEVWPQEAFDYARDADDEDADLADDERWLRVWNEGSRASYHDMVFFITTVDDPVSADRLTEAIHGRGAFRRFKNVLAREHEELERWLAFAEERQRGRARAWLADAGYRVEVARTSSP